ncbi:Protein tyrosine phosphatase type IVA 1 [Borealophlyctis nickersoniae]|nr:Protein tyrosine phosphatase type IVA 1 [Borealophlyctis nickersoniae]
MPGRIPFSRIMSEVEHRNMRFVILDCPSEATLQPYIEELVARGVTDVVRLCEPTYSAERLRERGIQVHDWAFKDGGVPPHQILQSFLALCDERFGGVIGGGTGGGGSAAHVAVAADASPASSDSNNSAAVATHPGPVIAVHCVAGLGRAPVLVAVALIESGMAPIDAIEFIRRRRRGAFNSVQLSYLMDSYKRFWKKTGGNNGGGGGIGMSMGIGGIKAAGGLFTTVARAGSPEGRRSNASNGSASGGGNNSAGVAALRESFGKVFRFKKNHQQQQQQATQPQPPRPQQQQVQAVV